MKLNYGKTIYNFQVSGDPAVVNNIVQGWLTANGFNLVNKFNETYYYYNDAWHGNRCFQYTIEGNVLTVYAWTIAIGNKFVMLDSGAYNNMAGDAYKSALNSLFSEINLHCGPGMNQNQGMAQASNMTQDPGMAQAPNMTQDPNMAQNPYMAQNPGMYQNPYGTTPDSSQFVDAFQKDITEKNDKLCVAGFVMAIIGLLLAFLGITYGIMLYILEVYFAIMGLKSSKKGLAIATFIIVGVSILIIIAQLIGL